MPSSRPSSLEPTRLNPQSTDNSRQWTLSNPLTISRPKPTQNLKLRHHNPNLPPSIRIQLHHDRQPGEHAGHGTPPTPARRKARQRHDHTQILLPEPIRLRTIPTLPRESHPKLSSRSSAERVPRRSTRHLPDIIQSLGREERRLLSFSCCAGRRTGIPLWPGDIYRAARVGFRRVCGTSRRRVLPGGRDWIDPPTGRICAA